MKELRNLAFQIISLLDKFKELTLAEIVEKSRFNYENVKNSVILLEEKKLIIKKREGGKLIIFLNPEISVY